MNNKYFLLRHGETIYQTKKKEMTYPGLENDPVKLTKKGEARIKKVARLLKKKKINLIYSSDVFRARQTAEIVAKELKLEAIFDSRLRDLNLGIYHNRPKEEFYQSFPRTSKKRFYKKPSKGESWSDVKKRMINFLNDIEEKHKGKTILIVSHGDPLWLLGGEIRGLSEEELLKQKSQDRAIKVGELRE